MKPKKAGGYSYTLTKAQIKKFMDLPVKARLEWLEEANKFLWLAMDEKAKKTRDMLRKGEI